MTVSVDGRLYTVRGENGAHDKAMAECLTALKKCCGGITKMSTERKRAPGVLAHSNAQSVKSWPIDALFYRTRPAVKRTLFDIMRGALP